MGWKDSIPPLAPTQLQVSQIGPNVFRLDWAPPTKASDGESVWSYNVYRSSSPNIPFNDPSNLIAILGRATTSYSDTIDTPGSAAYYYAMSALDRANNESAPSPVTSGIVREMLALTSRLRSVTSLSLSVASQDPVPILIAFHIPERAFVSLDLFKQEEVLVSTVLRGICDGGTYVVGIRREQLDPGRYLVRLKAADTTLDEPVEVRP